MSSEQRLERVTGWECNEHGLAFETLVAAQAHGTDDRCHAWRPRSLTALQLQVDAAERDLADREQDLRNARSAIARASAAHRPVRLAHEEAKERVADARRLWAERAATAAKQILKGES